MIVYVTTQGSRIVKEGRHLLVKKGNDTFQTLFTHKLKQLVLFGNIEITHFALCQLLFHNIDTVYLTQYGRYLGRLALLESKNIFLHKKQFELLNDNTFCLKMSKAIVAGKLANMATYLMRIKRSRKETIVGVLAKQIQDLIIKLENADNIDTVRGYEGKGSSIYFEGLRYAFIDEMGFSKRVRRPPTDPINSVLSLIYTFLMNRVYSAVRIANLNPYIGFLHSLDYGRYSLVLDLMEEFRSIIADTLTVSLFNLKILQQKDFFIEKYIETEQVDNQNYDVTADPIGNINFNCSDSNLFDLPEQKMDESHVESKQITGKYPVKLRNDAFKNTIHNFEKKMTTTFYYPLADKKLSYMDALIYQAGQYRKVIEGDIDVYKPILLK